MHTNASFISIAVIHTLFNILSTVILIPFTNQIERAACTLIKGKKNDEDMVANPTHTLDDRFLDYPAYAIERSRNLVVDMALTAKESLIAAIGLVDTYDKEIIDKIHQNEKKIDTFEDKISSYLVKIASRDLSKSDSETTTKLLHIIGDIERIGDHAENLVDVAEEIYQKKIQFSEEARKEIEIISDATIEILEITMSALEKDDIELAKHIEPLEQIIDKLKHKLKNRHFARLQAGKCTIELGFVFSDLLTNYERTADHCSNIGVCLIQIANDTVDSHEYLRNIKHSGDNDFIAQYEFFKEKYSI
jgi:phosphate:Na+ symporter